MLIGYMRPYQDDLKCEEQLKTLEKCSCTMIVSEEHSSAKKVQLKNMIDNLKPDDKIVVTKLFTLADSTRHLVELLQVIDNKGAYIYFVQEDIDTSNANGYHFGDIVKHLVDFQSDVISEKRRKACMKRNKRELQQGVLENLMRM